MAKSDKQGEATTAPAKAQEPKAPKQKRPTRAQLQQLTRGGDYQFDPATGAIKTRREPTKPAPPKRRKEASQ